MRLLWRFIFSLFLWVAMGAGAAFSLDQSAAEARILALNREIIAANERKDLPAALRAAEEAVRVAKEEFGAESLEAAGTMSNLGSLYLHIKRAAEAEAIYRKIIQIELERSDPEGAGIAAAYFNLGAAYAMQQKYGAAIEALKKSYAIRIKKLGPEDVATKNAEQMIASLAKLSSSGAGKN
jgi:tetratricopeptide (TPR) repeat protein